MEEFFSIACKKTLSPHFALSYPQLTLLAFSEGIHHQSHGQEPATGAKETALSKTGKNVLYFFCRKYFCLFPLVTIFVFEIRNRPHLVLFARREPGEISEAGRRRGAMYATCIWLKEGTLCKASK